MNDGAPGTILLDTNVVSEAIKSEPRPSVHAWLDAQVAEPLFLSSVTVAELLLGVGVLAEGRRKPLLAARRYSELAVRARTAGRGFPTPDGYIAAIATAHGFGQASRSASTLDAARLAVINPWAT